METITLTKQDLVQIVEQEVSKRLDGLKSVNSNSIFAQVRISAEEFERINKKYDYTNYLSKGRMCKLNNPVSLRKYKFGFERVHYKAYASDIHDHIRKLTLSAFGVTLNSDLRESEYEDAARMYEEIKKFYLYRYEKRLSKLSLEDFE